MKYLIGIDIGTSGTKTVLFTLNGEPVASHTCEYPLYQPANGYAEQDPSDWWNAVVESVSAVLNKSGADSAEIVGVGLSGQMHGLVMLDKNGEVLRRSIIWCDQRTARECEEITSLVGAERLIEITANPALTGFTASKILWVRNNEPATYERCRHILLPKDYIRYKLTGEFATEVSDASGMQLLDVPGRCWSDEVLEKLGIDKALLGTVYESPEITGQLTPEAARLTGLKAGTVVVGGAGDNAAAAVGTGVVVDGKAFTTIGSSGVVFAHSSTISIDAKGRVHTFCCAVPGAWHVMGVTQAAGMSRKWFRDTFCAQEVELARSRGVDSYDILDEKAAESPIGANKLLYLPYLMGERTPHLDAAARGVFFGLSAMHTGGDLSRAVLEGVSYSLKDCLSVLEEMRVNIGDMALCGGGSASILWRQMLADIFGCPVKTIASKEGPALGVALLAGVGAGIYKSVPSACADIIRPGEGYKPNPENTAEYLKFYEVYKDLYPHLRESFAALGAIQ